MYLKKINYTQQPYKCKSKKFGCVSLNDLHLYTQHYSKTNKFFLKKDSFVRVDERLV